MSHAEGKKVERAQGTAALPATDLRALVEEKENMITILKEKTKTYVTKLREDHHTEMEELRKSLAYSTESLTRAEGTHAAALTKAATEKEQAASEFSILQRKVSTLDTATAELVAQRDELQNKNSTLTAANSTLTAAASQVEAELEEVRQAKEHEAAAHLKEMQEMQDKIHALRNKEAAVAAGQNDELVKLTQRVEELTVALSASEHAHSRLQSDFKTMVATKQSLEQELDSGRHSIAEQARLANSEAESNREMKKKMKVYVEALVAEKSKLTTEYGLVSSERNTLMTKNAALEQNFAEEEAKWRTQLDTANADLSASQATVAQRDKDIAYMKASMSSHGVTSQEQIIAVQREKDQMRTELEDHKAKRFAARNEMISFAQTLERAHADMKEFKYLIQQDLSPMVAEHITGIESVLTGLEMANSQLSSSKMSPTFSPINRRKSEGGRHGKEDGGAHGSGTAETLHHLQILRQDILRATTGINLLSNAVLRLQQHTTKKNDQNCCAALAAYFRREGSPRGRLKVETNRGNYDRVTMDTSLGSISPPGGSRFTITSEDDIDAM